MGGTNCNSKGELKKGPWTRDEDQKLLDYIEEHGCGSWRSLPSKAGLQRCGKSCRLRWTNYLRPGIKRGKFSTHEEKTIIRLHALLGNRWSAIAAHISKRTDNEIKNYWNTRLKKRLTRMGIDPKTHKPKNNPDGGAVSHMAQWESARLEAEARLARESKLVHNFPLLHNKLITSRPPPPPPRQLAAPPCLDVLKVWQSTGIPTCFFSSPRGSSSSLESPTPTLNASSCNSVTVPFSSVMEKEYGACYFSEDKTEISPHEDDIAYNLAPSCEEGTGAGAMDMAALNQQDFEECEEDSMNYWSYLLDLVSSPIMESPAW